MILTKEISVEEPPISDLIDGRSRSLFPRKREQIYHGSCDRIRDRVGDSGNIPLAANVRFSVVIETHKT